VGGAESDSPHRDRIAVVACGALSTDIASIAERRGWGIDVHPLPPLLHNHPERIAGQVAQLADQLASSYDRIAVGYADCGSYGAVDEVCRSRGLPRLGGRPVDAQMMCWISSLSRLALPVATILPAAPTMILRPALSLPRL